MLIVIIIVYGVLFSSELNFHVALLGCVLGGVLFLLGYVFDQARDQLMYGKINETIKNLEADLIEDENVIVDGPANCIQRKDGLGKLFLTNKRLIFTTQSRNKQINYPLSIIYGVDYIKSVGVFKKGIIIHFEESDEKYIVDYPNDWLELIKILID